MNTRLLDALACKNWGRPPVWLMRQSGRHLSSYRQLRKQYPFLTLCHQPELIAQTTCLPLHHYPLDAAILFSDILVIPEAMGLGLRFEEPGGPIIERPIQDPQTLSLIDKKIDIGKLFYVAEGIRAVLPQLSVPLIGFSGAPFTLATYVIEGKTSRTFSHTKRWLFRDPPTFHHLLSLLTDWVIAYLKLQIDAGVHVVQLFDSWASILSHEEFGTFCLPYLSRILEEIKPYGIPVILFCRGSSLFAPLLAPLHPQGIGIDWSGYLPDIRKTIPQHIALQGNFDPDLLFAPKERIIKTVSQVVDEMRPYPNYIVNLGHGLSPDTSEASVHALIEAVETTWMKSSF